MLNTSSCWQSLETTSKTYFDQKDKVMLIYNHMSAHPHAPDTFEPSPFSRIIALDHCCTIAPEENASCQVLESLNKELTSFLMVFHKGKSDTVLMPHFVAKVTPTSPVTINCARKRKFCEIIEAE